MIISEGTVSRINMISSADISRKPGISFSSIVPVFFTVDFATVDGDRKFKRQN